MPRLSTGSGCECEPGAVFAKEHRARAAATGCVRHLASRVRKLATRATVFVRAATRDRRARTVFLQQSTVAAPATAMPACRGWCLQEPPRHQRRAARLRSSWHGQRGCCWPRCDRCGHQAGPRLVALLAHSVSVQRAALWPRQSSASWFVDEYGSRALDNIEQCARTRLWCNGDPSAVR